MRRGRGFKWGQRLQQAGYKITRPRDLILELFSKYPKRHLSAEDVFLLSRNLSLPGLSLASIYRNLELLEQLGILRKINVGGKNKYEMNDGTEEQHHHHIICTNCGTVINYTEFLDEEKNLIEKIEAKISKKYKITIKKHDLTFFGICEKCAKEQGAQQE